jgi:hypothetical protein
MVGDIAVLFLVFSFIFHTTISDLKTDKDAFVPQPHLVWSPAVWKYGQFYWFSSIISANGVVLQHRPSTVSSFNSSETANPLLISRSYQRRHRHSLVLEANVRCFWLQSSRQDGHELHTLASRMRQSMITLMALANKSLGKGLPGDE